MLQSATMTTPRALVLAAALLAGCTPLEAPPAPLQPIPGLTPPRSTTDISDDEPGPELRITALAIAFAAADVLPLIAGRPAPDAFTRHVSPPLRDALAPAAARVRIRRDSDILDHHAHMRVLADRATPFATLGDALFTATKAGFTSFALTVQDDHQRRNQSFGVPLAWFDYDRDIKISRPVEVLLRVRPDAVLASVAGGAEHTIPNRTACDPPPAGCHDLAAITDFAARTKELLPNEVVVTLRVADELPLQAVVAVIDAVRGPGCRLSRAVKGEKVPDDCLFWQPILDRDPPLRFTSDVAE